MRRLSHLSPLVVVVRSLVLLALACDGGDGGIDADRRCEACDSDEICVQLLHGNTGGCQDLGVTCQPRHPTCVGTACTPECNFWQCGRGMDAGVIGCPGSLGCALIPEALHCYGS